MPGKALTAEWVDVTTSAHRTGIRTTATMMLHTTNPLKTYDDNKDIQKIQEVSLNLVCPCHSCLTIILLVKDEWRRTIYMDDDLIYASPDIFIHIIFPALVNCPDHFPGTNIQRTIAVFTLLRRKQWY